jgi:hypothetical protein
MGRENKPICDLPEVVTSHNTSVFYYQYLTSPRSFCPFFSRFLFVEKKCVPFLTRNKLRAPFLFFSVYSTLNTVVCLPTTFRVSVAVTVSS